jgi:SbsC C-terminal domain
VKRLFAFIMIVILLFTAFPFQKTEAAYTYSQAEKLVVQAEKWAGALKWQISVEYNKTLSMPDMKLFNSTKTAYSTAQTAVNSLKDSRKAALQYRLDQNVKLHINRAVAYIDALNGGKKIEKLSNELRYLIKEEIYMIRMDDLYHELSYEIRKQAILLYRVYGKSTREAILAKYKLPAEQLKSKVAYFVTVKDLVDKAKLEISKDEVDIYLMINYLDKANSMLDKITPEHAMRALQTDIVKLSSELSSISEYYFEGPMIEGLNTEDGFQETMIVIFDMADYLQEELYLLEEPLKYQETRIITFEFEGFEYTVLLYKTDENPWVRPDYYTLDITEI